MTNEEDEELREKLKNLESGDYLDYNELYKELEDSSIVFETESLYHDSVGYLESWRLGDLGEIVIDAMNGEPMVRKVQNVEEVDLE